MRKFRGIWTDTHVCTTEGWQCSECLEEIYLNDEYIRTVIEYVTERGESTLDVHREHSRPTCNPQGLNKW